MKKPIAALAEGKDFTRAEAESVAELVLSGQASDAQIASMLTALRVKGQRVDETLGFASVLLGKANTIAPKAET